MIRLLLAVAVEIIVGVALGGALLAILVPVLSYRGFVHSNLAVTIVIVGVLAICVGSMVLRPGSALNRRFER